jgi:hypothetical protein
VINNQFQRSFTLTVSITVIGTAVALLTTP